MSDTNELRAVKLTARRRDVLEYLGTGGLTFNRICDILCRHPSSVRSLMGRMQKAGLVRQKGRCDAYFATDAGRKLLSTADARAPSVEEGKHG